jgi:2-methylcitrate dehydratase PrpD
MDATHSKQVHTAKACFDGIFAAYSARDGLLGPVPTADDVWFASSFSRWATAAATPITPPVAVVWNTFKTSTHSKSLL